jgi:hypothetical protein
MNIPNGKVAKDIFAAVEKCGDARQSDHALEHGHILDTMVIRLQQSSNLGKHGLETVLENFEKIDTTLKNVANAKENQE